jgi:hypothetical protein
VELICQAGRQANSTGCQNVLAGMFNHLCMCVCALCDAPRVDSCTLFSHVCCNANVLGQCAPPVQLFNLEPENLKIERPSFGGDH